MVITDYISYITLKPSKCSSCNLIIHHSTVSKRFTYTLNSDMWPTGPMVNPGWCTRLFGLELSSVLYSYVANTTFLYSNNDVLPPLLTPYILTLHVNLLMMLGVSILVILICTSSLCSGLEILHQREGLITDAECERIGSTHHYDRREVMARIILAKSSSKSLKLCEICDQCQLLDREDMKQVKGVSVCDLCII